MITLKLTDPIKYIEGKVNSSLAKLLNERLYSKLGIIKNDLSALVGGWIREQPEIKSLLSRDPSSLAGHFGIPSGQADNSVEAIIVAIQQTISYKFNKFNDSLEGSLLFVCQPTSFSNVLSISSGHVNYNNGKENVDLHWLDWLINRGDSIIVSDYEYKAAVGTGRSNLGTMKIGTSFRVPSAYSGTEDNNFITRALNGPTQYDKVTKLLTKHILS